MLTEKNIARFAELVKMGVPKAMADYSANILKNLPEENWAIFAKLDENPIEVELYNQENEINIDISMIQK